MAHMIPMIVLGRFDRYIPLSHFVSFILPPPSFASLYHKSVNISSEIFGLRRMWNNSLRELWNIAPSSQCEMKFASSHLRSKYFTAELFHMAKPYFTRRRRISLKKAHIVLVDKCVLFSGGGSWIRTSEVSDNRFTVCPLWPLGNSPIKYGAGERSRTINLLITNQLLCHWATPASVTVYIITEQNTFVKCFFKFFKYFYFAK